MSMQKWVQKHIKDLNEKGITFVPNVLSQNKCKYYIDRFEKLIKKFEKNRIPLNNSCQVIENPFRHDFKLIDLIYHKKIDEILKNKIEKNYVLINANIINRIYRSFKFQKKERLGKTWHHDSRFIGKKRLEKGFSYIAITMLNDFNDDNASTLYVEKSHNRRDQPKRRFNYRCKKITGKAGTVAIFDSGLWHKAGNVSKKNRWSMYAYYGPWFMKPYFRFPDMLGNKITNKTIQKLLHYHSTPPKNELERRYTLTRPL